MSTGASQMRGRGWTARLPEAAADWRASRWRSAGGLSQDGSAYKTGRPARGQRETPPHSCFPAIVWKRASLFRFFSVNPDISQTADGKDDRDLKRSKSHKICHCLPTVVPSPELWGFRPRDPCWWDSEHKTSVVRQYAITKKLNVFFFVHPPRDGAICPL